MILILAAGPGRRWSGRPRCLVKLKGETLLERQVRLARATLPDEPVVVVGPPGLPVPRRATLVPNPDPWDTGAACSADLGLGSRPGDGRLLLLPGDVATNAAALDGLAAGGGAAGVAPPGMLDATKVGVAADARSVRRLDFTMPRKWAGTLFLAGAGLSTFREAVAEVPRTAAAWEALNLLLDRGGRLAPHAPRAARYWEMDTPADAERCRRFLEECHAAARPDRDPVPPPPPRPR